MNNKYVLIAITMLGWGLWSFLSKLSLQRLHPIQVFMIGACISILLLPVYIYALRSSVAYSPISFGSIAIVILASLASTAGTIAYVYGIRSGELGTVAVISCAYPVIPFVLAVLFLGESLTFSKTIGVGLVLAGVIVLGR